IFLRIASPEFSCVPRIFLRAKAEGRRHVIVTRCVLRPPNFLAEINWILRPRNWGYFASPELGILRPRNCRCGLDFFGADNVVFASDCPFDPEGGPMFIRETIKSIESLGLSEDVKRKIYSENARRLLRLTVEQGLAG
ncbi:amidohydrolase family protein, partial [Novosphingobium sp. Fuku2-ISO-50]|uniref:amidohydrolase family protein n=1 Tax=Novosphingobium sp. Fuku2-ISO-50 TaxID=1739114 RepID=UPI0012E3A6C2